MAEIGKALSIYAMIPSLRTLKDTVTAYTWWGNVAFNSHMRRRRKLEAGGKRRLLLLAWSFPPVVSGGVYRPMSLVRYGTEYGWNISVLAGPAPAMPGPDGKHLLDCLPPDLCIGRVQLPTLRASYNWFPRVDGIGTLGFLQALNTFSLGQRVVGNERPDVVMASGPPFHSFVAAYYLARYFRARLVLDYRDEWTECPFPFVQLGNADRRWEAQCLTAADLVFFTTQSQLAHQVSTFPNLHPAKCQVIPNGWEPEDFVISDQLQDAPGRDGKLLISFVGALGRHCLPGKFLAVLEHLLQRRNECRQYLRVRFVGIKVQEALDQLTRFRYPEVLELVDNVPKPVANRMMHESSALLLLNNDAFARYIPGKLYDYLAAGPPILVFGDCIGEVRKLVQHLQSGLVVGNNDADALECALDALDVMPRSQDRPNVGDWLEDHTRKVTAYQMLEKLDYLCQVSLARCEIATTPHNR